MQTLNDSALKIGRDQQRQFRFLLQPVQQFRGFVRLVAVEKRRVPTHRHSERTDMILVDFVTKLQILGALDVQELGPHPDHEKLSNFFFRRELAQRFLRPLFAVAIKMDGTGMLEFIFGLTRHAEGKEQK